MPDDEAPGGLAYVEALVNTYCDEFEIDEVPTPEALAEWLRAHELLAEGVPVTAADHARTVRVREGLRALLAGNNGVEPAPDAVATLGALARELPLVVDPAAVPPRLVPAEPGTVDAALATVLAGMVEGIAAGTWHRLKSCRNEGCRWAYYDHSRNRSRSWCSMQVCGNRSKVRAFRERG